MITVGGIIREGNPTPRVATEEILVLVTEEDRQLGEDMLTSLKNSQDPIKAEGLQLRGGAGPVIPQLDISKRIIAVYVPSNDPENGTPSSSTVMYNPEILSRSVQDVCLDGEEGCLSADRDVPRHAVRHDKITAGYFGMAGEKYKVRLKDYEAIVVQHEIDHTNGIMFYDHINKENPFASKEGALIIG